MKNLCVMKFGGTCLTTPEDREQSVKLCLSELQSHNRAVIVVSAMGRKGDPYATDTLIGMIQTPSPEEESCLLACGEVVSATIFADMLREAGIASRAVTGWNAGLITDSPHCGADLQAVDSSYLRDALESNTCVVVAGFQGRSADGPVSTLGRGGSDITAAALAVALEASEVMLVKKVESVFTADPERVPNAMKLERISSEDIRQLAWQGAKVVHPRASEIAGDAGIRLSVLSHSTGRKVTDIEPCPFSSGKYITGVAAGPDVAQFRVGGKPVTTSFHGFYAGTFGAVADAGVSMDMFSVFDDMAVFTVPLGDTDTVSGVLDDECLEYRMISPCSKVSIVGAGMHGMRGVMARFARALDCAGIDMFQTVDSHATISALVMLDDRDRALRILHREFLEE